MANKVVFWGNTRREFLLIGVLLGTLLAVGAYFLGVALAQ